MGPFLALFAITAIVMLIVEFLGNKAVDGMENAVRSSMAAKRRKTCAPSAPTERLSERYTPRER